ncbi:MAG: helix-turn-helix domain-containing protein [Bacteroidaceae bacterium]|nr:helix-turn-helix domain-containing protein [Bacteroidaceae bacterium]
MENKLAEFNFDMMPTDLRKLVLDDLILLDDNFDIKEEFDYNNLPNLFTSLPLKLMFAMVMICTRGEMKLRLNLEEIHIKENDVLTLLPGTIGDEVYISPDCKLALMAFPKNAFPTLMKMEHSIRFREYLDQPMVNHLNKERIKDIIQVYELIRSVVQSNSSYKKEIILNLMEALSYYVIDNMSYQKDDVKLQRGDVLFHQFMDEVRKNYTKERRLAFYASTLCITPKYLSRVVVQHSGRHPSDWIRDYVILEAKALLRQNELSVQQISDMLNYPNPSFFGKYFKAAVGCSPRAFQLQVEQKN